MARKGRDLFEILRERSFGGGRVAAEREGRPARTHAPAAGGVSEKVGEVGRGVVDWMKRKVGVEPEPAPRPSPSQSGLILAAVAAIALLLGFVVGRATSGSPADAGDLNRSVSGRQEATVPGWVKQGDEVSQDPAEAERMLSKLGWMLLNFPALDRHKATDVAVWLRQNGLSTTRVRSLRADDDGSFWAAVICYTTPERAADDLAKLRALRAPDFAPELARTLAAIGEPEDVTFGRSN